MSRYSCFEVIAIDPASEAAFLKEYESEARRLLERYGH